MDMRCLSLVVNTLRLGLRACCVVRAVGDRVAVAKLQVGLLGSARALQRQLDRIASRADTTSPSGLHYILQGAPPTCFPTRFLQPTSSRCPHAMRRALCTPRAAAVLVQPYGHVANAHFTCRTPARPQGLKRLLCVCSQGSGANPSGDDQCSCNCGCRCSWFARYSAGCALLL